MDYIVQKIMNLPPLLEGYEEIKVGAMNPDFMWLRKICHIVKKFEKLGKDLTASEIIDLMSSSGMELPTGAENEPTDNTEGKGRKKADMAFGRKIAACFKIFGGKDENIISIDAFTVCRKMIHREYPGLDKVKDLKAYVFTEENICGASDKGENDNISQNSASEPMGTNTEPMENPSEPMELTAPFCNFLNFPI